MFVAGSHAMPTFAQDFAAKATVVAPLREEDLAKKFANASRR